MAWAVDGRGMNGLLHLCLMFQSNDSAELAKNLVKKGKPINQRLIKLDYEVELEDNGVLTSQKWFRVILKND